MSGAGQVRTTLLENLKELHLPAMRAGFEETARRAEKETLSYEQYLLELSVRECEQRRGNRMRRRLQGVLSARLRSVRPGRHGSEAVTLRHPVMPVANGLGRGLVGIDGDQL